jgi:hypothetical protein
MRIYVLSASRYDLTGLEARACRARRDRRVNMPPPSLWRPTATWCGMHISDIAKKNDLPVATSDDQRNDLVAHPLDYATGSQKRGESPQFCGYLSHKSPLMGQRVTGTS